MDVQELQKHALSMEKTNIHQIGYGSPSDPAGDGQWSVNLLPGM